MNKTLQSLLFLTIIFFLIFNFILPKTKQLDLKEKRNIHLQQRIATIEHQYKQISKLEQVLKENEKVSLEEQLFFYDGKQNYSLLMSQFQRKVQSYNSKIDIKPFKIQWVDIEQESNTTIVPLHLRITMQADTQQFAELYKKIKEDKKIIKTTSLAFFKVGGRKKNKKIRIIINLEAYGLKK